MQALRVRVLGGFEVEGIDTARLGSRKARILLKILALARSKPVPPEFLADCLWPDGSPHRPGNQLSVLVSRARNVLGPDVLVRSDAGYSLAVEWLDLDAMAALVDEGCRRLASGNTTAAAVAATASLALARGPLLPEDADAPWAEADRATAARVVAAARRIAADAALAAGDFVNAALLAQGALDDDGFDEPALRTLMAALAGDGRPASALAAYAEMRTRLAEELGVDPTADTDAVHHAILLAEPVPGLTANLGIDRTVDGDAPSRSRENRAVPPGRHAAIDTLDTQLDAARRGHGGLVVVVGEAGIGKTHLIDWWTARVATSATVLVGRCDELSRATPLQAIVDALEDHLRGLDADAAAHVLGQESDVLRPFMAPFVGAPPLPASGLRDWGGGQLVAFAAIVAVLTRLPAPAVLVLDDIHLAGSATLAWLEYVARRAGGLPVLVVATERPEEAVALPAAATIDLAPLDEAAAAELVGSERAAALVARSGGNPLFLIELADAESDVALPVSIQQAVAARCARAGSTAAATLRTAAIIGPEVDLDLLAAVVRTPPTELLDDLEEGARRGLLIESGGQFVFRHQLVRDALVETTSATRRAFAHREAGRALAARPTRDAYTVAHHARLGGDEALAAHALMEAAELASSRFDQIEALTLADAVIALIPSAPALVLRARVRMMLGDYAGALTDARAAGEDGAGSEALELQAWASHYRRDFAEAARLADDGAARAGRDGDSDERVGCLGVGGWTRQAAGDLTGAEERFSSAYESSSETWRPVSAMWLGGLRVHQGRVEEGLELLRPAMAGSVVAPWGSPTAHALLFGSQALAHLGRPLEALAAVDAIEADQARTGNVRWAGRAENTRGWILRNVGEETAADELNAAALERAGAIGMSEPMSHAHLDLAAGAMLRHRYDEAARSIEAARALGDRHALAWRHSMRADLYAAEIALATGRTEAALTLAGALVDTAGAMGVERHRALGSRVVARARHDLDMPVDLGRLDALLEALAGVAGLEVWRLTADAASTFAVDRWWSLAEGRAEALARVAGPYAETLRRVAAARLDRTRSSNTRD
ncbi:MAG TPA: BTAD domain-containing putative transcriptional regulator [Acidimicrobiales bacterium]